MNETRTNTLDWIKSHMEKLKLDNESDDINNIVEEMKGITIDMPIGLTKEILEEKTKC
ncbi:MAG: hypothetical protein IJ733_14110 [Lachnospiraceae bacterium]|nr:hypothetical protein [Lachnospiraceae bacterium]